MLCLTMEGRFLSKLFCNKRILTAYRARHISCCIKQRSSVKEEPFDTSKTHFGFQTVPEAEKEHKVYQVFQNVAEKYDVMNDMMSIGIHRLWKDYFVERLGPIAGSRIIDVAGGTGDIAFRCLEYMRNEEEGDSLEDTDINYGEAILGLEQEDSKSNKSSSHITVCDINQAMLNVGKTRADRNGYREGLTWLKGNAECLPVNDNTYDAYTIAFGIRNTTHIDKVLSEAYRILKPGGRFMCLEFSEVNNSILRKFYDEYSFQVIPVIGKIVAGDWHSYQYLVESIRKFPKQEDFASMIRFAGFKAVQYENLTLGVAAIHSGYKL